LEHEGTGVGLKGGAQVFPVLHPVDDLALIRIVNERPQVGTGLREVAVVE
jgi:hypothetical protein